MCYLVENTVATLPLYHIYHSSNISFFKKKIEKIREVPGRRKNSILKVLTKYKIAFIRHFLKQNFEALGDIVHKLFKGNHQKLGREG